MISRNDETGVVCKCKCGVEFVPKDNTSLMLCEPGTDIHKALYEAFDAMLCENCEEKRRKEEKIREYHRRLQIRLREMPQVAAEEAGKFGCGYNTDMSVEAPNAHLTAPIWHWSSVYTAEVQDLIEGKWQPVNYFLGLKENMVDISPLTKNVAEGTAEKIEEARAKIVSGEWDVFTGPIYSNTDELVVKEGESLADGDITGGLMTNLLIKGVEVK